MAQIATILLDNKDYYVYDDGQLPIRPEFDKELLKAMVSSNEVSPKGYEMLPPSIQKLVFKATPWLPVYPITIQEINDLADILLVVRGDSRKLQGKPFRLDKFKLIVKEGRIEIWILKKK